MAIWSDEQLPESGKYWSWRSAKDRQTPRQTYANNMSRFQQQSAALAAANANRPSTMQSTIGGGASGAIAGART